VFKNWKISKEMPKALQAAGLIPKSKKLKGGIHCSSKGFKRCSYGMNLFIIILGVLGLIASNWLML
jgi:hypothetical protein